METGNLVRMRQVRSTVLPYRVGDVSEGMMKSNSTLEHGPGPGPGRSVESVKNSPSSEVNGMPMLREGAKSAFPSL